MNLLNFFHKDKKLYNEGKLFYAYVLLITIITLYLDFNNSDFPVFNFRLISGGELIQGFLNSLRGKFSNLEYKTPDDPGFILLYTSTAFFSGIEKIVKYYEAKSFPLILKLSYLGIQIFISFLLISISDYFLDFKAKVLILLFSLMPNSLAVFLGFDVYVFPVYGFIAALYILTESVGKRITIFKLVTVSLFIGFCEEMRKWSIFPFYVFLGIIFFSQNYRVKNKIKILTICFFVSLIPKIPGKIFFDVRGHTVWHPIHAGLFEYGGCIDKKGSIYPFFAFDSEDVDEIFGVKCSYRWSDLIQYEIGKIHKIHDHTSADYENLLRNQVFEFVKNHPAQVLSLVVMRFLNATSFLPFKSHNRYGHFKSISASVFIEAVVFMTILFLWFRDEDKVFLKLFFLLSLAMSLAPAILVHSQHIIYNYPANFIQFLIVGMYFNQLIQKYLKHSQV